MRYRGHAVASILTVLAMAGIAALALDRLPPGTRLPVHWDGGGQPDRFAGAAFALLAPVGMAIAVSLLMAALPSIEPLQDRMEASAPLYRTAWGGLLAMTALAELLVAAAAFGIALPDGTALAATGIFLVVLGNALPKSRPGFFVGVRTPWTLTDPENWIATHRYAARIMIGGGAALVLVAALPIDGEARRSLIVATLLVIATTPVIYSFLVWRRSRAG